jgi:hypothetical protein
VESLEVRDTPAGLVPGDGSVPDSPPTTDPVLVAPANPPADPASPVGDPGGSGGPAVYNVPPTGNTPLPALPVDPIIPLGDAPIFTSAPNPVTPAPYVTVNFTAMVPIQQLVITVYLDNGVVNSVTINLEGADWDPNATGPGRTGVGTRVANELWAAGIDAVANGGIVTIRGNRTGTASVENVRVSLTQQYPPKLGFGEPNLPVVDGRNGATGSAGTNFPR